MTRHQLITRIEQREHSCEGGRLRHMNAPDNSANPVNAEQVLFVAVAILLRFPGEHLREQPRVGRMNHKPQRTHFAFDAPHQVLALFYLLGPSGSPLSRVQVVAV